MSNFCSNCGDSLYWNEKHVCEPDYTINPKDIAGFNLCSWMLPNGSIQLKNNIVIAKWPAEVELFGTTYTLEDVITGAVNDKGNTFQNAVYV